MALQVQQFTSSWYTYLSEKYEFVSWDDDIPKIWKVIKAMHVPNYIYIYISIDVCMYHYIYIYRERDIHVPNKYTNQSLFVGGVPCLNWLCRPASGRQIREIPEPKCWEIGENIIELVGRFHAIATIWVPQVIS